MTDHTAQVQQRLDDLKNPSTLHRAPFDPGTYVIRDTLTIHKSMGFRLQGSAGKNFSPASGWNPHRVGTIFEWHGPPDKPMLELSGCSGFVCEGIALEGKPSAGIVVRHGAGALSYTFRHCGLRTPVGIQWGEHYNELTCANVTYEDVEFRCSDAAVRVVNSQSLEHLFLRCDWSWGKTALDIEAGGDVTVIGGGTYQIEEFLRLGVIGKNTRGFDVQSVRFDGQGKRTAWLTFADPTVTRTYGTISFRNCTQAHNQITSDQPLVTAASGSRVVLDACGLTQGTVPQFAIHSTDRAAAELIVRDCDGFDVDEAVAAMQFTGPRSHYAFDRCGNLYGVTKSVSTFPGEGGPVQIPLQLTPEQVRAVQTLETWITTARGQ